MLYLSKCHHMATINRKTRNKIDEAKRKQNEIKCETCMLSYGRILVCTTCDYVGCYQHMKDHLKASETITKNTVRKKKRGRKPKIPRKDEYINVVEERHEVAYEPKQHLLYCNQCGDYILGKRKKKVDMNGTKQANLIKDIEDVNNYKSKLRSQTRNERINYRFKKNNNNRKRKRMHTEKSEEEEEEEEQARKNIKKKKKISTLEDDYKTVIQQLHTSSDSETEGQSSIELIGLRGLNNMGSTCFMNSIIQVLVHNPLIRNYMLAMGKPMPFSFHQQQSQQQRHNNKKMIQRKSETSSIAFLSRINNYSTIKGEEEEEEDDILIPKKKHTEAKTTLMAKLYVGIELQKIIQQMYSGKHAPVDPHEFMYSMWKSAGHLAGYQQHDAHEFLMAVLNALSSRPPYQKLTEFVFGGHLQSTIACSHCQAQHVKIDPILDISLHLVDHTANGDARLNSLEECLQLYTRVEKLQGTFNCSTCQEYRHACTQQLTIKKLPIVLSFHLKRFESLFDESYFGVPPHHQHSIMSKSNTTKMDHWVLFPFELDMSKYISRTSEKHHEIMYDLFGVVEHTGALDNGHYTAYIRHNNSWFLCDDACIYKVTEKQVQACQSYMLFYVKRELHYL